MKPTERLIPSDNADAKKVIGGNIGGYISLDPDMPQEVTDRAMRYVAGAARDAADARLLLETVGLIDPGTPRTRPKKGVKP